jgi:hypothetical protein
MNTVFWLENMKERDHSEDMGIDGVYFRIDLKEIGWESVDGYIWLRAGTSVGLL